MESKNLNGAEVVGRADELRNKKHVNFFSGKPYEISHS